MKKYQRRVIREKKQLDDKRKRLDAFIASSPEFNALPSIQQTILTLQYKVMTLYSDLLGERIRGFEP